MCASFTVVDKAQLLLRVPGLLDALPERKSGEQVLCICASDRLSPGYAAFGDACTWQWKIAGRPGDCLGG